jgi:hypothetical protein
MVRMWATRPWYADFQERIAFDSVLKHRDAGCFASFAGARGETAYEQIWKEKRRIE